MIPIRDDNPIRRVPVVTFALIGLCVLVYLSQLFAGTQGFRQAICFAVGRKRCKQPFPGRPFDARHERRAKLARSCRNFPLPGIQFEGYNAGP